jgi:membrane-associated protease RseP (regulator of RpoE activity)
MDLVELVTGDAAVAELKKQNPGSDPEYSDNQYAVVNDNKKVRKLPLASSLVVKVLDDSSSEPQVTVELSAVPQHFDGRLDSTLFWFVVEQGAVTRIEELYKS